MQSIPVPNLHSGADYLLYFIFGALGACRQAPYKFKKSYGGGFVWELPIVSTLRTGKPVIFTKTSGLGTCKFF
jgi:hypothetical protein